MMSEVDPGQRIISLPRNDEAYSVSERAWPSLRAKAPQQHELETYLTRVDTLAER